jgi:hypothetical protein
MKYISMKIEPNGNTPAIAASANGRVYHLPSGMGRSTCDTRHGKSPATALARPTNDNKAIDIPWMDMSTWS